MNPADAMQAAPVADMTLLGLFLQAHFVVKIVMIGLLSASIWCWSIIVDKTLLFRRTKAEMDAFEDAFWSGRSLEELFRSFNDRPATASPPCSSPPCGSGSAASRAPAGRSSRCRSASRSNSTSPSTARSSGWNRASLFLASIGSAGPYIGLFGTVWGIMTAFTSIAASKNTSLAVVAPGIAEALFATAIGLFAAIPAVLAYNKLQAEVSKAQSRLESFADEFSAILSRQIDERLPLAA